MLIRFSLLCLVLLGPMIQSSWAQDERRRKARPHAERERVEPRPPGVIEVVEKDGKVESALVKKGRVPVLDVLSFIQKATGKVVVYPSAGGVEREFDTNTTIDFLGDVVSFSPMMALSLLRANGYEFFEEALPDGTVFLRVLHVATRMRLPLSPVTAIIPPDEKIPTRDPETRATLLLPLEHADPEIMAKVLRELMGVGPKRLIIINVPNRQTLIIQARHEDLFFIREFARHLDKPGEKMPPVRAGDAAPKKEQESDM